MKVTPKDHKNFWRVIGLGFLLIVIFTILDVYGSLMWGATGGWEGNAYRTAGGMYQTLFWGFAYGFIAMVAVLYYNLRKDKSETLAVLITPILLLQFGLEDVLFYIFKGLNVFTDTMPWLTGNLVPPTLISRIFGYTVVQGPYLFISAIIGIGVVISLDKWLLARKW